MNRRRAIDRELAPRSLRQLCQMIQQSSEVPIKFTVTYSQPPIDLDEMARAWGIVRQCAVVGRCESFATAFVEESDFSLRHRIVDKMRRTISLLSSDIMAVANSSEQRSNDRSHHQIPAEGLRDVRAAGDAFDRPDRRVGLRQRAKASVRQISMVRAAKRAASRG